MHADNGDRVVIRGRVVGAPDRHGTVIEARGPDGTAPFLVRFDDGHETLIFPGGDVLVEHSSSSQAAE